MSTRPSDLQHVAPRLTHQGPIDGLRGVGAVCVVLVHAFYQPLQSFAGWVDVFFVITGFLTTAMLLDQHHRTGTVDVRGFVVKRVQRLLPSMWAVVAASAVAALAIGGDIVRTTLNDALSAVTLMYHVVHPLGSEILTNEWPQARPLIHLWAVTVEWHWYLTLPVLIAVGLRRGWTRGLLVVGGLAWIAIAVARGLGHVGPNLVWYQRPDSVLLGVLLALVDARLPEVTDARTITRLHRAGWAAAVVAAFTVLLGTPFGKLVGLYAPVNPFGDEPPLAEGLYWGRFGFSIVALCAAVVVWVTVRTPGFAATRFLGHPRFKGLGDHSYALYLTHVPIGVLLAEAAVGTPLEAGRPASVVLLPVYLVLLVVSTRFLHRHVELRFRKGR